MLNFASGRENWRLDVVSILAILGENNIKFNQLIISLSWTCLLPRLLPAPQGLLSERIKQLPYEEDVIVCGVFSGVRKNGLNYFPNIIHGYGLNEAPYTVREIQLKVKENSLHGFRLKQFGLLNLIATISCVISVGLLVWAILIGDGAATLGILIMSFTAPLLCIGTRTHLRPTLREKRIARGGGKNLWMPPGDVVIRSREGTFTIIRCDEELARDLYLGPERLEYATQSYVGHGIGGMVGGLTLMASILLFGNCSWTMQLAIFVTYALLNVVYWLAAMIYTRRPLTAWDASWLEVKLAKPIENRTFTDGLWEVIKLTQSADWARKSDTVPDNLAWHKWLDEAEAQAKAGNTDWRPQDALSRHLMEMREEVL